MEKVWFTSDNHFGHKNILKFCPETRMGKDAAEHDEIQIANWQRQVGQNDHVYLLGDVFFCDAVRARSIMNRLPGQKHLIFGNHDKVIHSNKDLRDMFVSVQDYKEIRVGGQKIIMFHFPMLEWNHMHHGAFHLYGHVHGDHCASPLVTRGRMMDAGIDGRPDGEVQAYGPMSLWEFAQINRIMSKRPIRTHHDNKDDE